MFVWPVIFVKQLASASECNGRALVFVWPALYNIHQRYVQHHKHYNASLPHKTYSHRQHPAGGLAVAGVAGLLALQG